MFDFWIEHDPLADDDEDTEEVVPPLTNRPTTYDETPMAVPKPKANARQGSLNAAAPQWQYLVATAIAVSVIYAALVLLKII